MGFDTAVLRCSDKYQNHDPGNFLLKIHKKTIFLLNYAAKNGCHGVKFYGFKSRILIFISRLSISIREIYFLN